MLLAAFVCALQAKDRNKEKISVTRDVKDFSSIHLESVGNIYFTQAENYSLRMEGLAQYVEKTTTEVKGKVLVIGSKEKNSNSKNINIYLSAPDLKDVVFMGVGSFVNKTPLKLDNVAFSMQGVGNLDVNDLTCNTLKIALEGVGKVDVNVYCKYLKVKAEGVGHVTVSGTATKTDISKGGIGGVNLRGLKVGE